MDINSKINIITCILIICTTGFNLYIALFISKKSAEMRQLRDLIHEEFRNGL